MRPPGDIRFPVLDNAPVAQMDRVLPSEGRGRGFESRLAHHLTVSSEGRGRGFESRLAHHLTVSSEGAALPLRYFSLLKSTLKACKY